MSLKMCHTVDTPKVVVGAYYFNGWSGKTNHITPSLKKDFKDREPKWGWVTGTPAAIKSQIDLAANSGLSFFSFCWYYVNSDSTRFRTHPLNEALGIYLRAPNQKRLKFNLLIANHEGAVIRKQDWNVVTNEWIKYFKNTQYIKVDGKPLLTIFSVKTLVAGFGSTQNVSIALAQLRSKAIVNGLQGVSIAACINNDNDLNMAKSCGFDILTAYNNHTAGFEAATSIVPIKNLDVAMVQEWNKFVSVGLPYIPSITLNWDPRPWATMSLSNATSPRYEGYSSQSIYRQIKEAQKWITTNQNATTKERLLLIYAWNEYGEGAWLTPALNDRKHYLSGLKNAILKH